MRHKLGWIGFSYLAGLICAEFFGTFTIGVFTVAAMLLISAVSVIKWVNQLYGRCFVYGFSCNVRSRHIHAYRIYSRD